MTTLEIHEIAEIAHETNRAYCNTLGDFSQRSWCSAPKWQVDSVIERVKAILNNPDQTPEQSHQSWLDRKQAEGWIYGPNTDGRAKTHPCILPYEHLPETQKVKNKLFIAVVKALAK